jgi:23S rRNA pseudouridine2605 synthase
MRLSKLLAERGLASRREADRIIGEGQVTVNGEVITHPGHPVEVDRDHVKVRGKILPARPGRVMLALYKPGGYVTTSVDPQDRPTVFDLLEDTRYHGAVQPVGRLDFGSEGLLLFTNDGELANRLTHPRFHVPKTYMVKVTGSLEPRKLALLRRGVPLEDGRTQPAVVEVKEDRGRNSWLRIVTREGRNRLVRRMVEFVGHRVLRLKRIAFGSVELGSLERGAFRVMPSEDVARLRALTDGEGQALFERWLAGQAKRPLDRPPFKGKRRRGRKSVPGRGPRRGANRNPPRKGRGRH